MKKKYFEEIYGYTPFVLMQVLADQRDFMVNEIILLQDKGLLETNDFDRINCGLLNIMRSHHLLE